MILGKALRAFTMTIFSMSLFFSTANPFLSSTGIRAATRPSSKARQRNHFEAADFHRDVCRARGLAVFSTSASTREREFAKDQAIANALLRLKRKLYELPVTEDASLALSLIRYPNLSTLLDDQLRVSESKSSSVPPDILEVEIQVPLNGLRRLLAPILLGKSIYQPREEGSKSKRKERAKSSSANKGDSLLILVEPDFDFHPGLLPLFNSNDPKRGRLLQRRIAQYLIEGGQLSYLDLESGKKREKEADGKILRADSVGGLGRASIYLSDPAADSLLDFLSADAKASTPEEKRELYIAYEEPSS